MSAIGYHADAGAFTALFRQCVVDDNRLMPEWSFVLLVNRLSQLTDCRNCQVPMSMTLDDADMRQST